MFFILTSCGVTYRKDNITHDLERLVEKDTGEKSKACVVGKTLYLDMKVDEITLPVESEAFLNAFNKIRTAVFDVSRVVLSSDSEVEFMVVTAYNSMYTVIIRFIENINDIKSYIHTQISKSDYESRGLFEVFGESVNEIITDKHDISNEEFIGRLVVLNLNAIKPYGWIFKYKSVRGKTLFLISLEKYDEETVSLVKKFLIEHLKCYLKKYNNPFEFVDIFTLNGKEVMSFPLGTE
jgi:hypothetical protein